MQATALMSDITRAADDGFDRIVRQREAQLLRIAYRMLGNWADAEDVAQEAFFRLHRQGMNFPNEAALGAWLYRVTVNLCLDRSRQTHVPEPRAIEELPELRGSSPSAETTLLREERKQLLLTALSTLPAKEKAAMVLREIEGLPTAEVAAILGSSEGTVRSQISKAMARLRTLLNKETHDRR
jgi:RNA polymerase sigma-70 factor, ECF subfamily